MGVDLSERQARCPADHPAAVGQLSQVVLPIKGTLMSIEKGNLHHQGKGNGRLGQRNQMMDKINLKLDRPVEMGGKG